MIHIKEIKIWNFWKDKKIALLAGGNTYYCVQKTAWKNWNVNQPLNPRREKALVPQSLHVCEWCDCNTKNPVGGRRVFSLIASLEMVYAIPTYKLRSTPAFGRRRRLPPAAAAMLVIMRYAQNKYRNSTYIFYGIISLCKFQYVSTQ